jgi:hypothetical protein
MQKRVPAPSRTDGRDGVAAACRGREPLRERRVDALANFVGDAVDADDDSDFINRQNLNPWPGAGPAFRPFEFEP